MARVWRRDTVGFIDFASMADDELASTLTSLRELISNGVEMRDRSGRVGALMVKVRVGEAEQDKRRRADRQPCPEHGLPGTARVCGMCDAETAMERAAESAAERYYEDGGASRDTIAAEDDFEREREAMDPGLTWLRERNGRCHIKGRDAGERDDR